MLKIIIKSRTNISFYPHESSRAMWRLKVHLGGGGEGGGQVQV